MKFTAIVTAHAKSPHEILGDLYYQTRPPDETLVFASDVPPEEVRELKRDFPWALWFIEPDRNDWGHEKREKGLWLARGEWMGFFNHDDKYDLRYIEKMLREGEKNEAIGAVYCMWNRIPNCHFSAGSSTSGNFIVKRKIARLVGYPKKNESLGKHEYEADGKFIQLIDRQTKVGKVDELLYWHNVR